MQFKDWQDLYNEMLRTFPSGAIECDNNGQILIYTGLKVSPDNHTALVDIGEEDERQEEAAGVLRGK